MAPRTFQLKIVGTSGLPWILSAQVNISVLNSLGPGDSKPLLLLWSPSSCPCHSLSTVPTYQVGWCWHRHHLRSLPSGLGQPLTPSELGQLGTLTTQSRPTGFATWSLCLRDEMKVVKVNCSPRKITHTHLPAILFTKSCWLCSESQPLVSSWRDALARQTWHSLKNAGSVLTTHHSQSPGLLPYREGTSFSEIHL